MTKKVKPLVQYINQLKTAQPRGGFGPTYIKIGTIQRRLAWPLRKDDTQNREAFQTFTFILFDEIGSNFSQNKIQEYL